MIVRCLGGLDYWRYGLERIADLARDNGFLFAAWVPHIPEVKRALGLSNAALGFALLGPAVGSLLSMAVVGRATSRFGSALITRNQAF